MSLVFIDGFESYGSIDNITLDPQWWPTQYNFANGIFFGVSSNARTNDGGHMVFTRGGYSLNCQPYNYPFGDTITVGFGFRKYGTNTAGPLYYIYDNSDTAVIELKIIAGDTYQVTNLITTDILGTTDPLILSTSVWNFLEFTVYFHATTGYIVLRMDGEIILDVQGINTACSVPEGWKFVRMWASYPDSNYAYIDDFYISDDTTTYGKNVAVYPLVPTAIGTSTEFEPVGEINNWENVDNIHWNSSINLDTETTDFNYALGNANLSDSFQLQDLDSTIVYVYGLAHKTCNTRHKRELASKVKSFIQIEDTKFESAIQELRYERKILNIIHSINPYTGLNWTLDDITNLQIGYTNVSYPDDP